MDFKTEKIISNFIQSQFPLFYQEEGPDFILFMKAYYEWLESDWGTPDDGTGGPIREARELYDYRDIDNTIEKFLEYFQKKYLYGIPFNVIANKRFLLKHILDVYRSKGTIQCYKLLFKLLYNEDVEIYLPGRDVLRVSDGTWVEPKYLEVTSSLTHNSDEMVHNLIGRTIIGVSSGTTAVVENYVRENYNNGVVTILYISNISPRGGDFEKGEKIVEPQFVNDTLEITAAPTVVGSLDRITVINGGQGYNLGDVIKIAHRDVSNGDVISYGIDGILKVTELSAGFGSLNFDIVRGGFGFTANAETFLYKNGSNGQNASFEVGSISSTQVIPYNTDLVCDYLTTQLDATAYALPANTSANLNSQIGSSLSFASQTFGTIFALDNIETGNGYDQSANVFVRSVQLSKPLSGTITYDSNSNFVNGTSTSFTNFFQNNDVIALQANSTLGSSLELAVIKTVANNISIELYGPPSKNSTASAQYRAAPTILPSQYALYEPVMVRPDGSIVGEDELIIAAPNTGNNVVAAAVALNSGKGYVDGEEVNAYLYGSVSNNISIVEGGTGYTNNDLIVFAGGEAGVIANGFITTNSTGGIVSANLVYGGSGYTSIPVLRIQTSNGSGAMLTATLQEFNTTSKIIARVQKAGTGKGRGYWSTTRGFLDADKYIQDSFYYQDYSYEIRVAQTLNKYKDILYDTFHVSGTELFGKYLINLYQSQKASVAAESKTIYPNSLSADSDSTISFLASSTVKRSDAVDVRADFTEYPYVGLTADFAFANTNVWSSPTIALIASTTYIKADSGKINDGYIKADTTTYRADNRKLIEYLYASTTRFRVDTNKITTTRYYV